MGSIDPLNGTVLGLPVEAGRFVQEQEFLELLLVVLVIGFAINIASSAVFSFVESNQLILVLTICAVTISISVILYLRSRAWRGRRRQEEENKKGRAAKDYLTSLTFDFILRFLSMLQADTDDLAESDLKKELHEPLTFTTSMLTKIDRPIDDLSIAVDIMWTLGLLGRWKVVASDPFGEILKQLAEHLPTERWSDYGHAIKQIVSELDHVIGIYESYLPTEVLVILPDLQAASQSFSRCALVMPMITRRYKKEKKENELLRRISTFSL